METLATAIQACEREEGPKSNQDVEEKEMTPWMCLGFNIKDQNNDTLRGIAKKVSLFTFCLRKQLLFIMIYKNEAKGR